MKSDLTIAQAYQHCLQLARNHYENFPVASYLLRPDLRPAVAAIYAFARQADDLADEGDAPAEIRLKKLDAWETLLSRCIKEEIEHPVFLALGDAIRRHGLPIDPLYDLLVAFRMDVTIHRYETVKELAFYCRHSANPIGRLMLALHGIHDPRAISCADALCTGLQLANFWQDLAIDLARGRCYLPTIWLKEEHRHMKPQELTEDVLHPALERACCWTREYFDKARDLLPRVPWRLRLQVAATLHGGLRILDRTARGNPFRQRPRLSRGDWICMIPPVLRDACWPGSVSGSPA
ncbi:MAG: squalene synthase HpnC [Zetaproteobacteria bacterium]|nr:MAG: squalene synthase HpnC [Zetaproteobacteria bacterium]